MGMGIGVGVGFASYPPPSPSSITNPKKRRRTNDMTAQATIDDPKKRRRTNNMTAQATIDDTLQLAMNPIMHNGLQQMHLQSPHNMGNPQMPGMNPLAAGNLNPMMFHMSNANSMNNLTIDNHMGNVGNLPNTNHFIINNTNQIIYNSNDAFRPCGVCHKLIYDNERATFCKSGCSSWFHINCTGLSKMAYELLMSDDDAQWTCNKCILSKNISLVMFKR